MKIQRKLWARVPSGKPVYKYKITNDSGAYVELCSIGAGIVSISVPDRKGKFGDVVLGYRKALDYIGDGPCSGKCPGRYANRIAKGHLEVAGKVYELPINNGPNHLHGGPEGFQNQVWASRKHNGGVEFKYVSEDGEMGYPGKMVVVARYEWTEANELRLTFRARTEAETVVNLTNHVYFNLEGKGSVLRHYLQMNASEYLPTDPTLIPVGAPEPVHGTPMDFRKSKTLGRDIRKPFPSLQYGKGYDACYVLDGWRKGQLQEAAELFSKPSGRFVKVFTTQPGLQIYTGNWLEGCPVGKKGRIWHDYGAVALECQHFPDSPNRKDYPSTVLKPGKTFHEAIIFAFGAR